jgi:hypothetical protein
MPTLNNLSTEEKAERKRMLAAKRQQRKRARDAAELEAQQARERAERPPPIEPDAAAKIALEKWERSKALAAARQRRKRARDAAIAAVNKAVSTADGSEAAMAMATKAALMEVGNPHPLAVRRPGRGKGLPELSPAEKADRRRRQATERQRRKRARDAAARALKAQQLEQGIYLNAAPPQITNGRRDDYTQPPTYSRPPPPPPQVPPPNESPSLGALDLLVFAAASADKAVESGGVRLGPRGDEDNPSKRLRQVATEVN